MSTENKSGVGRWMARGSIAAVMGSLFALGLVQGCGDDDANPNTKPDSGGLPDAGNPDTGAPKDGGVDAKADADPGPQPKKVALSTTGTDRLLNVTYDTDGNIYAVGVVSGASGPNADFESAVIKFFPSGEIDTSFGGPGAGGIARKNITVGGKNGEVARGIVIQPDADKTKSKIVIAATVEHAGALDERDRDIALVRFNMNGTLDTTFGEQQPGVAIFDLSPGVSFPTTLPDGGASTGYTADAQWGLVVLPDNKLIVTGSQKTPDTTTLPLRTDSDFAVVKVEADGKRLDQTFSADGVGQDGVFTWDPGNTADAGYRSASPRHGILQDGKIVMAGYQAEADGVVTPVVFKLAANGTLDTTFGVNGVFNRVVLNRVAEAYSVVAQGTNLVTVGYGRDRPSDPNDLISLRILPNGQNLDNAYGSNGIAKLSKTGVVTQGRTLLVLPDNRVLVAGNGQDTADVGEAMVGLLSANGQPDTNFGTNGRKLYNLGGTGDVFWGAALSPDKSKVAVVGYSTGNLASGTNEDSFLLLMPTP